MNDVQLNYVIKLADTNSLNKVADYFDTTYQSVSYQIENLEHELNVQIFKRTNKGTFLTDEGVLVYQFANNTLYSYTNLKRQVKNYKNIRLGIDLIHIPPDFIDFISLHCPLDVYLTPIDYNDMYGELNQNKIDCYIGYERDDDTSIPFIPLLNDFIGIALLSSSSLSSKQVIKYSDISNQKIQTGTYNWNGKNKIINSLLSLSNNIEILYEKTESLAIAEIYSGQSLGIMPCGYSFVFNDTVKIIPLENESIAYGIYYTTEELKANTLSQSIKSFINNPKK